MDEEYAIRRAQDISSRNGGWTYVVYRVQDLYDTRYYITTYDACMQPESGITRDDIVCLVRDGRIISN